jgi:chemotaxis protein methyltransferase WspC
LEREKISAQGYYLLGLVQDALGDRVSAIANYRKALYLEPHHTESLVHLAALAARGKTP